MPKISDCTPMRSDPVSAAPIRHVTVIVASLGRPDILAELMADLGAQTRQPDHIILSVTGPQDVPPGLQDGEALTIITGAKGLCAQRNRGLDALGPETDLVVFCDDDYVPAPSMIERAAAFFDANPDVAGASGRLIADGIHGAGFTPVEARVLIASRAHEINVAPLVPRRERHGLYGCNMLYRRAAIGALRFDERLPLYGWQEDIDFSAQVGRVGRIVGTWAFAGVHCGVKHGRSSGVGVGYSQVINPAYLARKGTMRPGYALQIVLNNLASNHWRALRPEPWVDRWGRVRGNWIGLIDLLRGRLTPERMVTLR